MCDAHNIYLFYSHVLQNSHEATPPACNHRSSNINEKEKGAEVRIVKLSCVQCRSNIAFFFLMLLLEYS